MIFLNISNKIIEYSFYALFLLVPLVFASNTSELFEFNKMWLTYAIALIIAAAWGVKMFHQRRIALQRTPLDIPILLFLVSQVISTIFSFDPYVSFWGYYSRFNGGLLSIVTYIFLYYALVTNFSKRGVARLEGVPSSARRDPPLAETEDIGWDEGATEPRAIIVVKRLLFVSLLSGLIVTLWGLPSHFGYDPTCLLFRGELNVSCWTEDFQPKIRIFSTLGQPAWLAAYLAILMPIAIAFTIKNPKSEARNPKQYQMTEIQNPKRFDQAKLSFEHLNFENSNLFRVSNFGFIIFFLLSVLFYLALLYTRSRSGFLAVSVSLGFFFVTYLWVNRKKSPITNHQSPITIILTLALITFFIGQPFSQLNKFTFEGIKNSFLTSKTNISTPNPQPPTPNYAGELGGTDSGKIRAIVWQGAINIWKDYPIFGTGVETFAFAYYKYKPPEHNLTSEWNFLYNKAHNEYLNYLATTGLFGLATYLFTIGYFLFLAIKKISKSKFLISNQIPNSKSQLGQLEIRSIRNLILALLASYISILVTNFFGFSVVITNIYLFMIPAFVFVLTGTKISSSSFWGGRRFDRLQNQDLSRVEPRDSGQARMTVFQWAAIVVLLFSIFYFLFSLMKFWIADTSYAYGHSLDRAGNHTDANSYLRSAVANHKDEPVFKDALAINDANVAINLLTTDESNASLASELAQEAINLSNDVTSKHPNNVVFWKNRVRVFYALSEADSSYLNQALSAIQKAASLGPNDASISYNLGILYGQNDDVKNGIQTLENTIRLKPDYRDAHYALGLFYHDLAVDEKGKAINPSFQEKAVEQMEYILNNLSPNDPAAKEALESWGEK